MDKDSIFDDKGRALTIKGSSTSGSGDTHTYYSQTLFRNVYEDSKSLTFMPYVNLNTSNFSKETALNLNGVTTLSEGKLGDYTVTQIEFLNDKTLIHYECSGSLNLCVHI